jgi:AAA family ATP:ADP antiporter
MVIAAAVLSGLLAIMLARIMARISPARLVPRLFALSALLLLAEWGLVTPARQAAAVLVYLHLTAVGAILVSGFWAIVNERFDPRTARQTIGRITAGGSMGGLLGGVLPDRVGAAFPLTTMLPILAMLTLIASGLVLAIEHGAAPHPGRDREGLEPIRSAAQVLRNSRYLLALAILVALTSSAESILDYVFKARASRTATTGEELLRFFAAFYTTTALIGIFIQVTALRTLLARLGIARSASLLPAGVSLGAMGAFLIPGLLSVVVARAVEVILRSSLFRASYELLFTPVAPGEKRATKLLLDVGAARVGDVAGGALILSMLAVANTGAMRWLLALTVLLSALALVAARRLHLGYVAALEGSLQRRAADLPDPIQDDAAALLQTVGGFELSGFHPRYPSAAADAEGLHTAAATLPLTPLSKAVHDGKAEEIRKVLTEHPIAADETETVIELLAWDAVAPEAIRALRPLAVSKAELMLKHLLDPDEDFAIRRRLVVALAAGRSLAIFEGLLQALDDRRFEVRYRAGRALSAMVGEISGLHIDRERVMQVILKEIGVERGVWESRQLIDLEEEFSPMESEVLRDRVSRSVEHLFTLLSLVLPRETLRLAFHALHTNDPYLRGTALEYLETVLPDSVWAKLSPLLEQGEVPAARVRGSASALQDLLASRESISLALAQLREREQNGKVSSRE